MQRYVFIFALVGACASAPVAGHAPSGFSSSESVSDTRAATSRVDKEHLNRQLDAYISSHGRNWGDAYKFSGFVHITHRGEVIYERGFGYADHSTKRPNTAQTSFRIGSVTKQFTAVAILQLEQRGELSVTDPISKHVPDYPAVGAGVTIHQLLTHTGGVPNYTAQPDLMEQRDKPMSVSQLMATFWDQSLDFKPGSKFSYSNSGYVILGAIIERVSGLSYAAYMKKHVFDPAGLIHTEVGDAPGAADRAIGYEVKDGAIVPAHAIDMSIPYAAGAIRSTAQDLQTWHRALLGDRILGTQAKQKMYRPEKDDYAYGWLVRDMDGHRAIAHNGGIDGFLTGYMRIMDEDLVVVVWSNNTVVTPSKITSNAVKAAFGAKLEPVDEPVTETLDPALMPRIEGNYTLTAASRQKLAAIGAPAALADGISQMTVRASERGIAVKPNGQSEFDAIPTGPATFANRAHRIEVTFTLGDKGKATLMKLTQGGLVLEYAPTP